MIYRSTYLRTTQYTTFSCNNDFIRPLTSPWNNFCRPPISLLTVSVKFHTRPSGRGRAVYATHRSVYVSEFLRPTTELSPNKRALSPCFLVLNGMGRAIQSLTKHGTGLWLVIGSRLGLSASRGWATIGEDVGDSRAAMLHIFRPKRARSDNEEAGIRNSAFCNALVCASMRMLSTVIIAAQVL